MFASKAAATPTKTATSSSNKFARQRSTLVARRFGDGAIEEAPMLQRTFGNEGSLGLVAHQDRFTNGDERRDRPKHGGSDLAREAPGVLWDFSRIPVFPPGRARRTETSSQLTVPPPPGIIQRKLEVGAVDDPLEHEADRVAEQVMRIPTPQFSIGHRAPQIDRKCSACDEEDGDAQRLQMKSVVSSQVIASEAPAIVHDVLCSPGQPLDPATRAFFEPRFGHNFGAVRIHADSDATQSARAVNARAYTIGPDIVFGNERFAPNATEGKRLLAHELAHVVQQSRGKRRDGEVTIGAPDSGPKSEARGVAGSVLSSGTARINGDGPVSVQRDTAPAATSAPSTPESRSLTPTERSVAEFVFGPSLNLDPIVIKESSIMSVGGYVRTLPDTIYVAPGTKDTISTDLLIHELTHCAQYQHGVSRVVTAAYAILAHYDYGGEQGLRDALATKKCFVNFNTEQQADIVRDYYLQVVSGATTYPWSVFVDQVRAQGACIWPSQPAPVADNPPSSTMTA